jgi:hypothetical protein
MPGTDSKYGKIFTEADVNRIIDFLSETGALSVSRDDISLETTLSAMREDQTVHSLDFDDQLVFCLVSGDQVATVAVEEYGNLCRANGCDDQHIYNVRTAAQSFREWQREHPELVKLPD